MKIDLGKALTLFANFGILIGILLVVYELNQNTRAMQTNSYQTLLTNVTNVSLTLAENSELNRIVMIGQERPSDLTPEEWLRFSNYSTTMLAQLEYAHLEYVSGGFSDLQWSAIEPSVATVVCSPGVTRFVRESGDAWFGQPFMSYLRNNVLPDCPASD